MAETHRDEIAKLESLFAANPEGRIFTHLAEAYRKAGDLDRAREVLEAGLRRHPEYSSAYVVLGRVLRGLGRSGEARDAFGRVLQLDAHNLVALRALGDIAAEEGDSAGALRFYKELLAVESGDEDLAERIARLESEFAAEAEPGAPAEAEAAAAPPAGLEPELVELGPGVIDLDAAMGSEPPLLDLPGAGDEGPGEALELPTGPDLDQALPELGGSQDEEGDLAGFDLSFGAPEAETPTEEAEPHAVPEALGLETFEPQAVEFEATEPGVDFGDAWIEATEDGELEGEVRTETIADLYMSQSLHHHAAEVYRELLEARPGDERLARKLARAERLAAGEEEGAPEPVGEAPAPEEPGTPEAGGLGLQGAAAGPEEAETPAADEDLELFIEEPEDLAAAAGPTEDIGLVTRETLDEEALASFQADVSVSGSMENYFEGVFGGEEEPAVAPEEPIAELQAAAGAAADEPVVEEAVAEAPIVEAPAAEEPAAEEPAAEEPAGGLEDLGLEYPGVENLGEVDLGEEDLEVEDLEVEEVEDLEVEDLEVEDLEVEGLEAPEWVEAPPEWIEEAPSPEALAGFGEGAEEEPGVVESPWTRGEAMGGTEATPYAWSEAEAQEAEPGPTIGAYFGALLGWRSSEGAEAGEGAEPDTVAEAWIEPPAEPAPAEAAGQEDEIDSLFEPAPPAQEAEEGDEIDALFGPPEEGEGADAGAEAEAEPAPRVTAREAAPRPTGSEEEEDLEMFRAWLQSLKH